MMPESLDAFENQAFDTSASVIAKDGELYDKLLAAAASVARDVADSATGNESGSARFIIEASRDLLARVRTEPAGKVPAEGAIFEGLEMFRSAWPALHSGEMEGESLFASIPGVWKRMMHEWPMGNFARMTADFLVERDLLGASVLELGAGVGSCSALLAEHVNDDYVRTDLQPFLLRRQKIRGKVERYNFDKPGEWRDLSTIFAVNALHCAADKQATLCYLKDMLRPRGTVLLGEGNPVTDGNGTPWALNPFFGVFRGWWDRGGFVPRATWLSLLQEAGFEDLGFTACRAGNHDLGGLVWGVKP